MNGGSASNSRGLCELAKASMGPPSMNGGSTSEQLAAKLGYGASMGPPSMNGGSSVAAVASGRTYLGFNGAAVDERRKFRDEDVSPLGNTALQWGRRR